MTLCKRGDVLVGDRPAHPRPAAGPGHVVVVEARVGPQHDGPPVARLAHPGEALGQEALGATAAVGRTAPQAGVDHLVAGRRRASGGTPSRGCSRTGNRPPWQGRRSSQTLESRSTPEQLARGPCPCLPTPARGPPGPPGPGSGHRPSRTSAGRCRAWRGARRRWPSTASVHPDRRTSASSMQSPPRQGGMDEGHRLHAGVGPPRCIAQADVPAVQLLEAQVLGQGGWQHQPGVGHEVGVVELHGQRIQAMRGSHLQVPF